MPDAFPPGFFDRADPSPDELFYTPPRLVTHIDDRAIAAVGALYDELGLDGDVLPGGRAREGTMCMDAAKAMAPAHARNPSTACRRWDPDAAAVLLAARLARGWSREGVAQAIGVNRATLWGGNRLTGAVLADRPRPRRRLPADRRGSGGGARCGAPRRGPGLPVRDTRVPADHRPGRPADAAAARRSGRRSTGPRGTVTATTHPWRWPTISPEDLAAVWAARLAALDARRPSGPACPGCGRPVTGRGTACSSACRARAWRDARRAAA